MKKFIFIILNLFLLTLISCHSEYINIGVKTDGSVSWAKDSSEFVFVARTELYRRPIGIAKFPDGGRSKNEYLDFSLYHFDIENKTLSHLTDLNEFYLGSAYRWLSIRQINLNLQDSLLFYKLIEPYDYNMQYIDEKKDTYFLKNIAKTYSINLHTHEKLVIDTTIHKHLFKNKREKLRSSSAKNYFLALKYSNWGINLKELYPQSKETYINYITLKEGNNSIRKAIFEQIVPEFTNNDRENILKKMRKLKKTIYKKINKLDKEKDPYRYTLAKDSYKSYIKYTKEIKRKLNIPVYNNEIAEKKEVFRNLKELGIIIPDDIKLKEVLFIGKGYEAKFELKEADSTNIIKYTKWFRFQVANLLNNKWEIDKQTKFEKPDSTGIVVWDEINFMAEHTGLIYKDKTITNYLDLSISYGTKNIGNYKYFTFSVSKEYSN